SPGLAARLDALLGAGGELAALASARPADTIAAGPDQRRPTRRSSRHRAGSGTSGLLVPSNYWRAAEVITAIDGTDTPGVADLREAYREYCPPSPAALPRGSS